MSKKRIVKQIDFTGEDHHCALVSKAANGESVLLMKNKQVDLNKAEEVKITTSMQTFLRTFFNMWEEDAEELAVLLGYEPQEWYWDMVGEDTEVEIMKSAVEDPKENKVVKTTYDNLKKSRVEFNKLKKAYDAEKEETMSGKEVDLQKSIDAAVQAALKKEREKYTDLEKSLKEKEDALVALQKAQEKKEKEEMTELCKGYSFVEDAEVLSDALFLCKSVKGFDVILDTLEKARNAIKAIDGKEVGTDEEADLVKETSFTKGVSKTSELIKARKKENK